MSQEWVAMGLPRIMRCPRSLRKQVCLSILNTVPIGSESWKLWWDKRIYLERGPPTLNTPIVNGKPENAYF